MTSMKKRALVIAAVLTALPASAVAQDAIAEKANEVTEQAEQVQEQADTLANEMNNESGYVAREEEDGFDWGLLGLLGLAGLLGLRKKDDHRDIHVDARRTDRP